MEWGHPQDGRPVLCTKSALYMISSLGGSKTEFLDLLSPKRRWTRASPNSTAVPASRGYKLAIFHHKLDFQIFGISLLVDPWAVRWSLQNKFSVQQRRGAAQMRRWLLWRGCGSVDYVGRLRSSKPSSESPAYHGQEDHMSERRMSACREIFERPVIERLSEQDATTQLQPGGEGLLEQ